MRCGSRRAVAERRRERENIHPPPNCMSRMGVPAAMGMEPDVCFLAPHRHASGHRLTGQWAIPFITWERASPQERRGPTTRPAPPIRHERWMRLA